MRCLSFALLACVLLVLVAHVAHAEVVTEEIDYRHGELQLQGFAAYDKAKEGRRPGVLLIHAWRGHGKNVREKAKKIAEFGYVGRGASAGMGFPVPSPGSTERVPTASLPQPC